jgi:hypothetical protein
VSVERVKAWGRDMGECLTTLKPSFVDALTVLQDAKRKFNIYKVGLAINKCILDVGLEARLCIIAHALKTERPDFTRLGKNKLAFDVQCIDLRVKNVVLGIYL